MRNRSLILLFTFSLLFTISYAQSFDYEIVNGKVEMIVVDKNQININSFSDKTHLKWEKFNVLANEKVVFNQPNENSCVLNQILSEPSKIFGSIESNGKVFLLNQKGILFGKDAKINVASFMASTLNIENIDSYFENGQMEFQGGNGFIINLGTIEALKGDVYLISKNIENRGKILSDTGNIALGCGDKIVIKPQESQKLYIESGLEDAMINNCGSIKALQVELKSQNPYAFAINHTGIIDAKSLDAKGSKIYLVAENSKINIKDRAKIYAKDGINTKAEIQILGDEIFIQDKSVIDISSMNAEEGNIYIGGGYQGKTPSLIASNRTYIGKDVRIHANSYTEGDGGKVVVWSDGLTQFYGYITSKGGRVFGNGGLIEVSGKKNLIFEGKIDTKSPQGKIGTLLLDPLNITISASGDANISSSGTDPITYFPTASGANLSNTTLSSALDGANVIVTTNVAGAEDGNITLNGAVYASSGAGGGSLTLNANNNIIFSTTASSFTFTVADEADFILNASNDIIFDADLTITNAKNITMTAGRDFQLNTGNVLDFNFASLINLSAGRDFNVENSGTTSSQINFTSSESLVINAGNDVKVLGRIENTVQGDISITATRDINIGPSTSTTSGEGESRSRVGTVAGDVKINAGNDLNVKAGGGVATSFAQIGYNAAGINSDIYLTVGRNVLVEANDASRDEYALIGHGGSFGLSAGLKKGNIIINNIGGNCTIIGKGKSGSTECFAQIGHAHTDGVTEVVLSGDIRGPTKGSYAKIGGKLELKSGLEVQAYSLIGHGGSNVRNNITINGDVLVRAHDIEVVAGSDQDTAACIGHRVRYNLGTGVVATINESSIKVKSDTNLLLEAGTGASSTSDSGSAIIGAYVDTRSNLRSGIIDIDVIDIEVGNFFTVLGGEISIRENLVVVGAKTVNTRASPHVVTGTSKSNLNITTGSKFALITRNGEDIYIQNGDTKTSGKTFKMNIGQDLSLQAEESGIHINAIDKMDLKVNRDLSLFAGALDVEIISQNTANIDVGRDVLLMGRCLAGSSPSQRDAKLIANTGNMNLFAGKNVNLGPFSYVQALGSGGITTIVTDNDFPSKWSMGSGGISMDAHSNIDGDVVRIFTVGRPNNFFQNITKSTFVDPTINNQLISLGPEFINSSIEQWSVYYPSNFGGVPYTIFYKDFALPSVLFFVQQDHRLLYPHYELFWKPFYLYKCLLNKNIKCEL